MKPARAPLCSSSALVTTVVACDSSDTSAGSMPCWSQALADALDHRLAEIVWRGQDFGDADAAAGFLDHGHVGEGAADVDADPPGHAVAP